MTNCCHQPALAGTHSSVSGGSASGERNSLARRNGAALDLNGKASAIERLRNEPPPSEMTGVAEQMTRDAVTGGVNVGRGRPGRHAMLRGIVHEDGGIAVLIVAALVQYRGNRQPGREEDEGL